MSTNLSILEADTIREGDLLYASSEPSAMEIEEHPRKKQKLDDKLAKYRFRPGTTPSRSSDVYEQIFVATRRIERNAYGMSKWNESYSWIDRDLVFDEKGNCRSYRESLKGKEPDTVCERSVLGKKAQLEYARDHPPMWPKCICNFCVEHRHLSLVPFQYVNNIQHESIHAQYK